MVDICTNPGPRGVHRPSISNTGAVVFGLRSGNSFDFVIRAKGGALDTIAGPGASPASTLSMAYKPSINNNDVVTFMGNLEDTGAGVPFTGAGGALTVIALWASIRPVRWPAMSEPDGSPRRRSGVGR